MPSGRDSFRRNRVAPWVRVHFSIIGRIGLGGASFFHFLWALEVVMGGW